MAAFVRVPIPMIVALFALVMSYLSQKLDSLSVPKDRFRVKYFANPDLQGTELVTTIEKQISHNWEEKSPGALVPHDRFSALWEGRFSFETGPYRFRVAADDGIRLWIDGQLLLDEWKPQSRSVFHRVAPMEKGYHAVRIEYFERTGKAGIEADWKYEEPSACQGVFCGSYYPNKKFKGEPVLTTIEPKIDHDWGEGGPGAGIGPDEFSVRWRGHFQFQSGIHRFRVRADDGIRVWVGSELIIDAWSYQPVLHIGEIELPGGNEVVVVEYFEGRSAASIKLDWEWREKTE